MAITFYKDLPLDFTPHPVSGDIRPITDETAIKRSLKNLILTKRGSKPFRPDYGSDVSNFLFSTPDRFTKNDLEKSLAETITRYESRVNLTRVVANFDNDGINLTIDFSIKNSGTQTSMNLTVKRTA